MSVQDPAALWNADSEQRAALFDSMVKQMAQNCLADNRLSAVICPEAKRDLELAKKLPAPPVAQRPDPAEKPVNGVAAKIDGILAGAGNSGNNVQTRDICTDSGSTSHMHAPYANLFQRLTFLMIHLPALVLGTCNACNDSPHRPCKCHST